MGSNQSQPQDRKEENNAPRVNSGQPNYSQEIKRLCLDFSISTSYVKVLAQKIYNDSLPVKLSDAKLTDERFKCFLNESCPKLQIFNELLYTLFKGLSYCIELETYDSTFKGVLKFDTIVEGFSLFTQKHPTIKAVARETLLLTALAYGSQSQQNSTDCEEEPEISSEGFVLLVNGILDCVSFISKRNLFTDKELKETGSFVNHIFSSETTENDVKITKPVHLIQSFLANNIPLWSIVIDDYLNGLIDASVQANVKSLTPLVISEILKFNRDYFPYLNTASKILSSKEIALLALNVANLIKPSSPRDSISYRWSWDRLYSASEHGFSMNRFETHIFKYPGPTLLILHCSGAQDEDVVIGAYVDQPWKSSKTAWGGPSTRVFQISPIFETFVPFEVTDSSSTLSMPLVLYHSSQGVGFGPTLNTSNLSVSRRRSVSNPIPFFLHIDTSLQFVNINKESLVMTTKPPFKPSSYSSRPNDRTLRKKLDIVEIEAYGLALKSAEALKAQKAEWKFDTDDAQRRQKINALSNPHDPMNRQLLVMAGVLDDDNEAQANYRAK